MGHIVYSLYYRLYNYNNNGLRDRYTIQPQFQMSDYI